MDKLIAVGKYKSEFNTILGINMESKEIYRSKGLPAHMLKSKHAKCLKYIDHIPDIIDNPDYIGINPNENGTESIEPIKRYKDNVMIGIKHKNGEYDVLPAPFAVFLNENNRNYVEPDISVI